MRRILFAAVLLFASTVMSFASLSASGSITWVKSGANYVYTLTLKNTGTTNVGFMFFGWIPGENYLPSTPSSAGTPSGWSLVGINPAGGGSGASIEWQANTPIAPGGSLTGFTFTTVDAPSKIFANTNLFADHNPITTTVVYSGGLFSDNGFQFDFSDATPNFSVTVPTAPTLGGSTVVGDINLALASSTATTVDITSTNPAAAAVSASIVISAGSTKGPFSILTKPVAVATAVHIYGKVGSQSEFTTLVVEPVTVALSVSVFGGDSAVGNVLLDKVSSTSTIVHLTSSVTSAATVVQSSITIPAESTKGTFNLATKGVNLATPVKISATIGTASYFQNITVEPATIAGLQFSLNPVKGGQPSVCTVTFNGRTGTVVGSISMKSNSPDAIVSSSASVAANVASTTFNIATKSVTAATSAVISVTYKGVTRTLTLSIDP